MKLALFGDTVEHWATLSGGAESARAELCVQRVEYGIPPSPCETLFLDGAIDTPVPHQRQLYRKPAVQSKCCVETHSIWISGAPFASTHFGTTVFYEVCHTERAQRASGRVARSSQSSERSDQVTALSTERRLNEEPALSPNRESGCNSRARREENRVGSCRSSVWLTFLCSYRSVALAERTVDGQTQFINSLSCLITAVQSHQVAKHESIQQALTMSFAHSSHHAGMSLPAHHTQMSAPAHHAGMSAPAPHSGLSSPKQNTGVSATSPGGLSECLRQNNTQVRLLCVARSWS